MRPIFGPLTLEGGMLRLARVIFPILMVLLISNLAESSPRFVQHYIDTSFNGAVHVHVDDMDADGDLDIVACGVDGNYIAWYEQQDDMAFVQHPVGSDVDGVYSVTAADFDEDGRMDIASAAYDAGTIDLWFQQEDGTFTNVVLATGYITAHTVEVADMNEDGHVDLLTMGGGNSPLRLYENDGAANFTLNPLHEITYRGQTCRPVDFDADGDMDVLSNNWNSSRYHLFRNDGEGNYLPELIGISSGAHWIIAADIDSDDILDPVTVAYFNNEIAVWYENYGFYNRTVIDDEMTGATYVEAADFDLDGDMDLVGSAEVLGQLAWYENEDAEFTKHILRSGFALSAGIEPADLDGDGDMDIVAASIGLDDIVWWELESIAPPTAFDLIYPTTDDTVRSADGVTVEWTESTDTDPGAEVSYTVLLGCATLPDTSWVEFDNVTSTSVQVLSEQMWPEVEPGEYEGVVYVYAGSQGDMVTCSNPAEVAVVITANTVDDPADASLPNTFRLLQAYPNPFNATTTISVELPIAADLVLSVYNLTGQRVVDLANGDFVAGTHRFSFAAGNLSSGIYFVQATVPGKLGAIQKIALVR
jgi:FG-GAP-like repeat/Secretion system C-terminal sorting domain